MGYKMNGWSGYQSSPAKQKVDPDAPGTPGTSGYEPSVKYSDLDKEGKKKWNELRKAKKVEGNAKTGHGGPKFPDVVYTADGTPKQTSQIDEEMLDLKPSVGPKGKFVNYTDESGNKTKYYYKKP
jgi:hypothetical protein